MNEIEKMYENAGIEMIGYCDYLSYCPCWTSCSDKCNNYNKVKWKRPSFTAKKQLNLLKFLSRLDLYGEVILRDSDNDCLVKVEILDPGFTLVKAYRNTMEEAIAAVINKQWEHLNDKQKQEVKEILE